MEQPRGEKSSGKEILRLRSERSLPSAHLLNREGDLLSAHLLNRERGKGNVSLRVRVC